MQATSALAAFLSPLFISLVALLPASSIGATAIALGSTGAFTMLSLLLLTLRRHHDVSIWPRISMLVLIVGQFAAYVIQIFLGADLLSNPGPRGPLGTLTSLMIIFFAFGVTRTWEYVDGLPIGRWGTISEATQRCGQRRLCWAAAELVPVVPDDHAARGKHQAAASPCDDVRVNDEVQATGSSLLDNGRTRGGAQGE